VVQLSGSGAVETTGVVRHPLAAIKTAARNSEFSPTDACRINQFVWERARNTPRRDGGKRRVINR